MLKKRSFISWLLIFCLCFSTTLPAFASNYEAVDNAKKVNICSSTDGTWHAVSSREIVNNSIVQIVEDQKFPGIYTSSSKQFFQETETDTYVPVIPINLMLNDDELYKILNAYNLPDEIIKDIGTMVVFAQEQNNNDAQITFFVLDNSNDTYRSSKQNLIPVTTTGWKGYTFHNYQIYFTDMWTSWQTIAEKGSTTQSVLNAIKTLTAITAGSTSAVIGGAINLYNGGKTCLNAWISATGKTPIYGNTNNKVMVDICYDIYNKYTYYYDVSLKQDRLGCVSQKAYIVEIDTDTYLYSSSGGQKITDVVYPGTTFKTPNYDYPEQTAFDHYVSPWTEKVRGKIYNKTVLFNFPDFSWPSTWPQY
jgi:hypothetical protein